MATSSWFGTCAKMLVACSVYHSVTAWVALLKFRKVHVVPLWLHGGGGQQEGFLWVGAAAGPPTLIARAARVLPAALPRVAPWCQGGQRLGRWAVCWHS